MVVSSHVSPRTWSLMPQVSGISGLSARIVPPRSPSGRADGHADDDTVRSEPRWGGGYVDVPCSAPTMNELSAGGLVQSPQVLALTSALCSAIGTMLIQRGLRRSNFYAGFWLNVAVGVVGLWGAVLLFVPPSEWDWRGLPYFIVS